MALFLVQHGKSLPKDVDPNQGLSEDGISESKRIADVAKNYGVKVDQIMHSVKTRARHTAEIFASALNPASGIEEVNGLKPMEDAAGFAATIDSGQNLMLVGHLPFMERMTSYLTTGSPEKSVFKFQNSGIVCLEQDTGTNWWSIVWSLMPNIG